MASNYDFGLNIPDSVSKSAGMRMYEDQKTRTPSAELGKDEFLKVLIAQMSNQNPMEPTSDTEFIAQMAQFSALEQMNNMANAMHSQRAYSMIGKEVTATSVVDSEGNAYSMDVYGKVTGVSKLNGVEYLVVYDYVMESEILVPPDSVRTTFDSVSVLDQMSSIYDLLNKLLTATTAMSEKIEKMGMTSTGNTNTNNTNTDNTNNNTNTDNNKVDNTDPTNQTDPTDQTDPTNQTDPTDPGSDEGGEGGGEGGEIPTP